MDISPSILLVGAAKPAEGVDDFPSCISEASSRTPSVSSVSALHAPSYNTNVEDAAHAFRCDLHRPWPGSRLSAIDWSTQAFQQLEGIFSAGHS